MVKSLSFVLLGLLAAITSAAPLCSRPPHPYQEVFSNSEIQDGPYSPVVPLSQNKDLENAMKRLIREKMTITYDKEAYLEALKEEVCPGPGEDFRLVDCKVGFLAYGHPTVRIIPTTQLTDVFLCTLETCVYSFHETVLVETTHSDESGLALQAGAKPFALGVSFTSQDGFGFSDDHKSPALLEQEFKMNKGDVGHIAMVNAQIETHVYITGCKCFASESDQLCRSRCDTPEGNYLVHTEKGHHEVVITLEDKPVSLLALIIQ